MSVTFIAILAPAKIESVECYFCDDGVIDPACPICLGSGTMSRETSTLPEINIANNNAESLLQLVSPDKLNRDLCGEWEVSELPEIRRTLIRLLNSENDRSYAVEEPSYVRTPSKIVDANGIPQIQGGCGIINAGRTDEYLVKRLNQLLDLVSKAHELQSPIAWN